MKFEQGNSRLWVGREGTGWMVGLGLVFAALWFNLGQSPWWAKDEGRYAEASREMLAGEDWIVPHVDGRVRLNKPPLIYWAGALAFRWGGLREAAARGASVVAGGIGAAGVVLLGRVLFGPTAGWISGFVLLTSLFYGACCRLFVPDIFLTAAFTLTLAAAWRALEGREVARPGGEGEEGNVPTRQRSTVPMLTYYALAGGAGGLAMLAKGPVGPGLAVVILALTLTLTRRWRQVYGPGVALALAALVVVAAPWYLAAEAREPGFLRYFFLAENLERYATERYHHVQPFYFYLLPVLFGFFPWTGHLIALAWRDRRQPLPDTERRAVFFLRVWALTVVLFFSASQTKRVGYHLPWRAWLLMTPLITLADTLPVSLGGLGVRETASVLFLLTLGVEAPSALASSLLWEGVVLLTSLPGGLALLQSSDCADRSAL